MFDSSMFAKSSGSLAAMALVFVVQSAAAEVLVDGKNVTVTGTDRVLVTSEEVQVDVQGGATATIASTGPAYTILSRGGVVELSTTTDSWQNKALLWLDASCAESLGWESNKTTGAISTVKDVDGTTLRQAINFWYDRRPEQRTWFGYNGRGAGETTGTYPSVMPYVVENGCNGLPYVSLGKCADWGRRLPFITLNADGSINDNYGGEAPVPTGAKTVVMVFGSQNGGGQAVLSHMPRASTTDTKAETGIFDTQRNVWIDGEKVAECQTTGLNGGWQIITVDTANPAAEIKGLGYSSWRSVFGGQNYAEVIVFANALTDLERVSVERYLAKKWGIADYPSAAVSAVRLFGEGTAAAGAGKFRVGGEFRGTLAVGADATVTFCDTMTAPANPAWIVTGGTDTLWYDTDRADLAIYTTLSGAAAEGHNLNEMKNRANTGYYPLRGEGRGAYWVDVARGLGPVRRWFDYRISQSGGSGNTSRFVGSGATGNTFNAKTGFMVLDTRAGGGTPLLDTSVYSSDTQYLAGRANASSPIFTVRKGHESLTNSPAYLNGFPVKSGTHAFNSRPEVLSFSFDVSVPVKCFGNWAQNTDEFELRHGEVILYAGTLSDAQRRSTEAYLMKKWLGITPEGYGDASLTTVTGAGTVELADGAPRPKIASSFAGKVVCGAFGFAIDASGAVTDALDLSGCTLEAAAETTISVSFADGAARAGDYTLIRLGTLANPVQWKLAPVEGLGRKTAELVCKDDSVVLRVASPGLLLYLR